MQNTKEAQLSKQADHILVANNAPSWHRQLVEILDHSRSVAEAVTAIQIALETLCQDISHLLTADDEQEDNDQNNSDGITLLNSLQEGGLSEARKIVALWAHDTKGRMRTAFRDLNVVDFTGDCDHQPLRENVRTSFDKQIGANLAIFWVGIGAEQAVCFLQIEDEQVNQDEQLKRQVTTELDDLLRQLFSDAKSVIVQPLVSTPSRSGMGVLSVQPFYATGGGQAVVLKFGHFPRVKKEVQHFQNFVRPFVSGMCHTTIENTARTPLLGGVVYSLLQQHPQTEHKGSTRLGRLPDAGTSSWAGAVGTGQAQGTVPTAPVRAPTVLNTLSVMRTIIAGTTRMARQACMVGSTSKHPKRSYDFASEATHSSWCDFEQFYRYNTRDRITSALHHLFHETCGFWYANQGCLHSRNLTVDYCRQFGSSVEQLENTIKGTLPSIAISRDHLSFTNLTRNRRFTNPFQAIRGRTFIYPTYESITHGDLNPKNIFVDNALGIWLIDFEKTEHSHVLRDFATLDAVIRFQLLETEEATLDERLAMEEALLSVAHFSQLERLLSACKTSNPAVEKAYHIICFLRMLARWAIDRNPCDDMNEYYVALLYNALFTLQFFSLSPRQREHALLSASLLAEKVSQQDER